MSPISRKMLISSFLSMVYEVNIWLTSTNKCSLHEKNDFCCHSLPSGAIGKNLTAHALVKVFRPVQDFKMFGAQFWVKEDGGKTNTVRGHKLDHLALNSTTAVTCKAGFTLASAATAVVEFMAKWSNSCSAYGTFLLVNKPYKNWRQEEFARYLNGWQEMRYPTFVIFLLLTIYNT